jgi:hypothetical protein
MGDNNRVNSERISLLANRGSTRLVALTLGFSNIRDTVAAAGFSPPPRETHC